MNLISIVVPIYNAEKYLVRCIESIINQTYRQIEIILVDDGSTDSSIEICNSYKKKDGRIKVIAQKNCGVSSARNIGLDNATGEFVMFIDSDDWVELNICDSMVNLAVQHKCDIVFCSYTKCYNNKSVRKNIIETNKDVIIFDKKTTKEFLLRRIIGLIGIELRRPEHMDSIVTATAKLYRRELITNIKFISIKEIGTEDALFNIEVFGTAKKCCYLNQNLYNYWRSNSSSLTRNFDFSLYSRWNNLFAMIEKYIKEKKLDSTYSNALSNRIALSIIGIGINVVSSDINFKKKKEDLKKILSDKNYEKALKNLDLNYFDFKWKIFFYSAIHKHINILYFMLYVISKITRRQP